MISSATEISGVIFDFPKLIFFFFKNFMSTLSVPDPSLKIYFRSDNLLIISFLYISVPAII